jgi:SAM-dependent methyltransferase
MVIYGMGGAMFWTGIPEREPVRLGGTVLAGNTIALSRMPVTMPGEMGVRDWLHRHAGESLRRVGVKHGHRVLDYGCGPGIFTVPCAQIVGEAGKVYALDVRPRALEQVKRRAADAGLKNIETLLQKPGNLSTGLPAGKIDVVLIFDMMKDVEDRPALLEEAGRVLRAGSFLSIFPMHMGNRPVLELVKASGLFSLRDIFDPPNSRSASSILNFIKNAPPRERPGQ